jgi:hypothetical protein
MIHLKSYLPFLEEIEIMANDAPNLKIAKTSLNSETDEIEEFKSKLKPGLDRLYKDTKDPVERGKKVDQLLGTENVNKYANDYKIILNDIESVEKKQNSILGDVADINADKSLLASSSNTEDNKDIKARINQQIADRNMKKSKTQSEINKLKTDIDKRHSDFEQKMTKNIKDVENDIKTLSKGQK